MALAPDPLVVDIQQILKAKGYTLGVSGPNRDGVDGVAGSRTYNAVLLELRKAEIAKVSPPVPVITPKPPEAVLTLSPGQNMIDMSFLRMAFPENPGTDLATWLAPTIKSCVRWGIDTFREIASFLANIDVESAGLTRMTESLNYSSDALVSLFGRHRISAEDVVRYGRTKDHPANQEMLANILYGGAFGLKNLGNTQPGDGWKFRGDGPKQITGRDNHQRFADAMGMNIEDTIPYIHTPEGGMMAAGWFWKSHNLDAMAATPGVQDDRKAINGGLNGITEVEQRFNQLIAEMLRREGARK